VIRAAELIQRKRDGGELSADEIVELVLAYTSGEVPDYQVAAFLMAVFFQGLSTAETFALTDAMVRSGETIDLGAAIGRRVVDKHSTGGVGDKTTLVVAPLVAAARVPVGKMSGRGLGFSGGTIDKLESIPGWRASLSTEEFFAGIRDVGLVVAAQGPDLAPADGRMYALRDVTGTVDSLPLIAGSIMSKKLAAGANAIVLDVKVGSGAFMKTLAEARALAQAMVAIGHEAGLQVRAVISDMAQPLGFAIGNALEVREAIATLQGHGPADLLELALVLGTELLAMAGQGESDEARRARLLDGLQRGAALAKLRAFVVNQGGDGTYIDDPDRLPTAPVQTPLPAPQDGTIAAIDAEALGRATVALGAGRATKADTIDHAVGIVLARKVGETVRAGEPLLIIHARDDAQVATVTPALLAAYRWHAGPVERPPLVKDIIR
jgi:pyrimidine-nucleoside phosphorylase